MSWLALLAMLNVACNLTLGKAPASPAPTPSRVRMTNTQMPVPTAVPFTAAPNVMHSKNWAGYAVLTTPGNVTDVRGQWMVPAVTCSSMATYSAIWVGIDGTSGDSIQQIGTGQDCNQGIAFYYAWFELFPAPSRNLHQVEIQAGDLINAEVAYIGKDQFRLSLTNVTRSQTFTVTRQFPGSARLSAEWIVEAPYENGILPLAAFAPVQWSDCMATVKNTTGPIINKHWYHRAYGMFTEQGVMQAEPSTLTADSTGFLVRWRHA